MGRLSNTIALAKASWKVLKADKELLLLPIMSMVSTVIVAASFLVPLFVVGGLGEELAGADYVVLAAMYFTLAFVTIFFTAALVHAADERLRGGDPTLGSALRGARRRIRRILPWAIVSATVSLILRAIEERAGFIGRIVAGLAGGAWSVVTFLVIPILVLEDIGVGDAIKRSGSLFKRTWGENIAAQVGFGLLGFLAFLPAVALIVVSAGAGEAALGIAIVVGVLWMGTVVVVLAALNGIFQAALYHYAVDGQVPGEYFSPQTFAGAFAPRKGRGRGAF